MSVLPDPANSRAVLIGVDSTPRHRGLHALPAVRNNVTDLAAALTSPAIWGLAPRNCVVPPDVSDARQVATTVERVAAEATDTLVIYFAGHGLPDTDDGELILAVGDTTEQSPKFTGLRYAWLREAVRRVRAERLVVVLDCCFSGRVLKQPLAVIAGQIDIGGTYVITSSPANTASKAPVGARHTAFTGGLLKVLHGGVAGGPERLRLSDIYDQVLNEMVLGGFPRPQQVNTNTVGQLEIVHNRAWSLPERRPVVRRETRRPMSLTDAVRAELAETMLLQFGDVAAVEALTESLLAESAREIERGADPGELLIALQRGVDDVRTRLARRARAADLERVIVSALGQADLAAKTAAAFARAGAGNVEVGVATGAAVEVEWTSRLTLTTKLLAPNAAATPVVLDGPVVAVSGTGEIDARVLAADPALKGRPLLVVAPRLLPHVARRLMFVTPKVVVVYPASADLLPGLCALTGADRAGTVLGRAYRVMVTASTTTIMAGDAPELADTGRAVVRVEPSALPLARRALAIARAAADGGVVDGAVAREVAGRLPEGPVQRVLKSVDVVPQPDGVVPLVTVQGALGHSLATVARLLTA